MITDTKTFLLAMAVAVGGVIPAVVRADEAVNGCVECHSAVNEDIVAEFKNDVHARAGLSCESCHGGNPALEDEAAMDPAYGFAGAPDKREQPDFCGKCHGNPRYMQVYNPSLPTDQVEKFWTSRHGRLLKRGDRKVASCASCHQAHRILPANTPRSSVYPANVPATCAKCHADAEYMGEYGIPTDQYVQYSDSANVHGYALFVKRDMGAPACNDCHGNHGANPPGVDDVARVCTQCHSHNGELFRSSPHKEAFDAMELSECAFCHQKAPDVAEPHRRIHLIVHPTRELIGTAAGAVCRECHSEGDEGWDAAAQIRVWRDSLDFRMERAESWLEEAETKGLEVSDARWMLDGDVKHNFMELRTAVHAFDLGAYQPYFQRADSSLGLVLEAAGEAMQELKGRYIYFVLITFFIALAAVAVAMKIRQFSRDRT